MATKLGRFLTFLDALLLIKWHYSLITWSVEITWQTNHFISNTAVATFTKLGRLMTYLERLLRIKLLELVFRWSFKITWQTKTIIQSLIQSPWPTNLGGWWLTLKRSYQNSHLNLVSAISFFFSANDSYKKFWKMLIMLFKKLFPLSRYSNFRISLFPSLSPCQPLLDKIIKEILKFMTSAIV